MAKRITEGQTNQNTQVEADATNAETSAGVSINTSTGSGTTGSPAADPAVAQSAPTAAPGQPRPRFLVEAGEGKTLPATNRTDGKYETDNVHIAYSLVLAGQLVTDTRTGKRWYGGKAAAKPGASSPA